MGIPKFFLHINERYPCLTQKIKYYEFAEFDNFYLDMTGIIHVCSHPGDSDIHFRLTTSDFTEEEIFENISHYVESLVRVVKPQRLLFLAFDGVTPRAKINQQRSRRFRVAETIDIGARRHSVFDTNCIMPGTLFMKKLIDHIKRFIEHKVSTDKQWQICKVILSGPEVPGEGEHKILDYIRYIRSECNYCPNTKHCLYGLDTDLIMLSLSIHEPHFSLLREEVKFGKNKRKILPEETIFCFLHISLLRNYIEHEFSSLKNNLPFAFDIEKVIDDWILLVFLVGNDFIPNLPNLYVPNNCLEDLFSVYLTVLPTLNGYINEAGVLQLERFEQFLKALSYLDKTFFTVHGTKDEDDVAFAQHKHKYYREKLKIENVDENTLQTLSEEYVKAIQWNLYYYYDGCPSWSWYYPYHYAPFISDITGFKYLNIEFEMGKPFRPLQHLLAVLPPKSNHLLPGCFQSLTTQESPISEYYPRDVEIDQNGKMHDWEAVVLIPFIDEKKFLQSIEPYNSKLTNEEQERNTHGCMIEFTFAETILGILTSPTNSFMHNHAAVQLILPEDRRVEKSKLVKGLCTGVNLNAHIPGFSTLRFVQHTATLQQAQVKIFGSSSRVTNMVLHIVPKDVLYISHLASDLLGKTVFVGWPHLIEACVIAISNCNTKISLHHHQIPYSLNNCKKDIIKGTAYIEWREKVALITEDNMIKKGIEIGDVHLLVHVAHVIGKRYVITDGNVTCQIQYNEVLTDYAYQTVVKDMSVLKSSVNVYTTIDELFRKDTMCFMTKFPHYGTMVKVANIKQGEQHIKVIMQPQSEPNFTELLSELPPVGMQYVDGNTASEQLGISSHLLSRITGAIYIQSDEEHSARKVTHNVGLNLKFTKRNAEVPGYTKRREGQWYYSSNTIDLIRAYMDTNPDLFNQLAFHIGKKLFNEKELFPTGSKKLQETVQWLKEQPRYCVESCTCGSITLNTIVFQKLEKNITSFLMSAVQYAGDTHTLEVRPEELFTANLCSENLPFDNAVEHRLLDRIICIRENFAVPMGYRGTIVGIEDNDGHYLNNVYTIVFDNNFTGSFKLNQCRSLPAYRLTAAHFMNISFGIRLEHRDLEVNQKPPDFLKNFDTLNISKPHIESGVQSSLGVPRQHCEQSIPPLDTRRESSFRHRFNDARERFQHTTREEMATPMQRRFSAVRELYNMRGSSGQPIPPLLSTSRSQNYRDCSQRTLHKETINQQRGFLRPRNVQNNGHMSSRFQPQSAGGSTSEEGNQNAYFARKKTAKY